MENQREYFVKWMKYLFIIQVVIGAVGVLAALPVLGTLVLWANRILSIVVVVVLFKLAPLNGRYKKAAIAMSVSIALGIVTASGISLLATVSVLVGAICSLVCKYQEYCGHAEMIETADAKLAKKWHSLFRWNIFSGIIVGILGGVMVVVSTLAFAMSREILTAITTLLIDGVDLILWIVYLVFLKRTYVLYGECEKIEMNDSYE